MVGLSPELLGSPFTGILSWGWTLHIPPLAAIFDASVFLLGLMTLTFSWYGFNSSVHKEPVLYRSIPGMFRFFLDAFLIVLYGFMLLMFERFGVVFLTLVVVFGLYVVWDWLKIVEYWNEPWVDATEEDTGENQGSVGWYIRALWNQKSLKYFFVLSVVFAVYLGNRWFLGVVRLDWVFLGGLILATTIYRFEKMEFNHRGPPKVVARIKGHNENQRTQ